jgi:MFS family permease
LSSSGHRGPPPADPDRRKARFLGGISADLSPLRLSVPFRSLLFGQVVSLIGTQMRYVALAWQVFQLTGSSVAVGLLGLAEVVPMLALTVHAGAMADARDRKLMMAWGQSGGMLVSIGLFFLAVWNEAPLWSIYTLTALGAAADTIDRPARTAIIPSLVGEAKLPAAMALRQITFQVSYIVGPAVGGLAIASFSIATVYGIDAITFVAALISLRFVPRSRTSQEPVRTRHLVAEGLKASIGRPLIRSVFVVDLIAMVFGMPRSVFPALAEQSFGLGARGLGLLYAAPSGGSSHRRLPERLGPGRETFWTRHPARRCRMGSGDHAGGDHGLLLAGHAAVPRPRRCGRRVQRGVPQHPRPGSDARPSEGTRHSSEHAGRYGRAQDRRRGGGAGGRVSGSKGVGDLRGLAVSRRPWWSGAARRGAAWLRATANGSIGEPSAPESEDCLRS